MCWNLMAMAVAGLLGACATYSEKIPPTYVSSVIYDHLTCRQIAEEATRVAPRAAEHLAHKMPKPTKTMLLRQLPS
jgi:hypothetical protein